MDLISYLVSLVQKLLPLSLLVCLPNPDSVSSSELMDDTTISGVPIFRVSVELFEPTEDGLAVESSTRGQLFDGRFPRRRASRFTALSISVLKIFRLYSTEREQCKHVDASSNRSPCSSSVCGLTTIESRFRPFSEPSEWILEREDVEGLRDLQCLFC